MSQQLVDKLVYQVEQHIHGRQREKILSQLERNPTSDAVASLTYELITKMDKQATDRNADIGIDVILAVATETIDMLVEILEAMGALQTSPDELREESLMKMVLLHMQMVEDDPAEKAAAQELLAAMVEDGSMDEAMTHIQQQASASPEQMQMMGAQAAMPQQKPVAAGVQRGLMQG